MTETIGTTILMKTEEGEGRLYFINEIGRIDAVIDDDTNMAEGVLHITICAATPKKEVESKEELTKNIIQVLIGCFSEDGEETEGWWKNVSKIDASIRLGSPFSENYFTSYDVPIVVARDAHDPEDIFDSWYSEYKDAEFQNSITPYVEWAMWELGGI